MRQDARWRLDDDGYVPLRPDLVWYVGGRAVAVVDAKYKVEKPEGFSNADVYQALAYCTALGLRQGHLVYAAGNEEPRRHVVGGAGVEVVAHVLDLSASPDLLLVQLGRLGAAIAEPARRQVGASTSQVGRRPLPFTSISPRGTQV